MKFSEVVIGTFNFVGPLKIEHLMRFLGLLLTQTLLILAIFAAILLGFFVKDQQDTEPIQSVTTRKFKSSLDPVIMAHMTDIHVDTNRPKTGPLYDLALNVSTIYKPSHLFITGDLVNNWGTHAVCQYGDQFEPDFSMYYNITLKYISNFPLFTDQIGNHDEFGVRSFSSRNHLFRKYSFTYANYSDKDLFKFWASTIYQDDSAFLILNPIIYPFPHALIDSWAHPTTAMLDHIEEQLDIIKNVSQIFVLTHFPVTFWTEEHLSSSGRSFRQIISENNVTMAITGHAHPKIGITFHHGKVIEILASDLASHHSIGIITIDNGNTVYHQVNVDSPTQLLVTNPVPKSQLSKMNSFSENSLKIRAISLVKTGITVSGDVNGQMEFVREVKPGVFLYELECNLVNGDHSIVVGGERVDFFVGSSLPSKKETFYDFRYIFRSLVVLSAAAWVIAFIITFPIKLPFFQSKTESLMNSYLSWIEESQGPHIYSPIVIQFICFGPLYMRWLIHKLPLRVRLMEFAAVLSPLFIPVGFFWIEDSLCSLFLYGYLADGVIYPEIFGCMLCMIFIIFSLFPSMFSLSGIQASHKNAIFSAFYLTCQILGFAVCLFISNFNLVQALGPIFANLSPLLTFVPLILIAFVWMLAFGQSSEQTEDSHFNTFTLLSEKNEIL